jgi:hypothetical protein
VADDGPIPFGSADAEEPLRRRERLRRARGRRFFRALLAGAFLLALALGVVARLAAVGLPEAWTDAIADALSTDDFAVELDRVSFSVASMRLRVGEARVYAKGSLLPPVAEARGTAVVLRPGLSRPGPGWIQSLAVESFSMPEVPDLPDSPEETDDGPTLPDFGPVSVRCLAADILGLRAHSLRANLSVRGGQLVLSEGTASTHGPGEKPQRLEGVFRVDPDAYRFSSEGTGHLDPNRLCELLRRVGEPGIAEELAKFEFPGEKPHVDASWRYDPRANERMLRLVLSCGPARYNGVPVSGFSGTVVVTGDGGWREVRVEDLRVERPEGTVAGTIRLLPRENLLAFRAESTFDPLRALALVGVLGADEEIPVAFDNPTRATISGVLDYGAETLGAGATDIRGEGRCPGVASAKLRFEDATGSFSITNGVLAATNLAATCFGGSVAGSLRLGLDEGRRFSAEARAGGVSWDRVHAFAHGETPPEDGRGTVEAHATIEAPADDLFGGDLRTATGTVSVSLRESQVFRIPFFTDLVGILGAVVPGVDLLMDRDSLELRGALADGVLDVGKLDIEGTAFSIAGRGRVWAEDKSLDLTLDVHLLNRGTWLGAGVYWLTTPFSKIFAIRASGTVDEPEWSSARLSSGKK